MIVLRPTQDPGASPTSKRYQVIAGCPGPPYYGLFPQRALGLQGVEDFRIYADPPNGEKPDAKARERSGGNVSHPQSLRLTWMPAGQGPQVSGEFGDKAFKDLEIRAGQVNEWTVSLPDELIAFVRDKLNRQKTADVDP